MDKIRTFRRRKTSASSICKEDKLPTLRKGAKVRKHDPFKHLLDTDKMGAAIVQCLFENDYKGVLEVIEGYLYALNKTQFAKEAEIPRSTMYKLMKTKNPTIKTLAKILHASTS